MCGTKRDQSNIQKIIACENDYIENLEDLISGASNFNLIQNSSSDGASGTINTSSITACSGINDNYTAKNNLKNLPNNYDISNSHSNLHISSTAANNNINTNISNNKYSLSSNELEAQHERRIRQIKRQADWIWLNACIGVVENNLAAVDHYLSRGGNVGKR